MRIRDVDEVTATTQIRSMVEEIHHTAIHNNQFIIMVQEDTVGVLTRTIRITEEDLHGTETKEGMAQIIDVTQVIVIQVLMKGNEAEDCTKGHLLPTTITGFSIMNDNPK
ncbi:unnamed protein product [Trichobilharzia szidati]|nr:unnamed protein product [Trichobilharzia szidati]